MSVAIDSFCHVIEANCNPFNLIAFYLLYIIVYIELVEEIWLLGRKWTDKWQKPNLHMYL